MKFVVNVWVAVKTTPKKACLFALIVPGGFVCLFVWILIKSILKRARRERAKTKSLP